MDIRDYLRVLRAGWALLLLGVLLGGGAALGISMRLTPQYSAETQLFVSTTGSSDLATAVQGNDYAQQKVASYAQLIRSKELATAVQQDLALDQTPQELMQRISASVVTDTTILDVTVTENSPEQALEVARSVDSQFQQLVRRLETPEGSSTSPVRVTVIATPGLPTSPSSPATVPNTALGALLGFVLAAVVTVLRDRLDVTVKDDATAAEVAGAPVIGHIPTDAELLKAHVTTDNSASRAAEAFRHVRTNLNFLRVDDPPRSILVSSSLAAEGKTTVAVNLARSLAASGKRVVLVDADLRQPRVAGYLGLVGGVGLTNVLTGQVAAADVLQPCADERLQVLGAGPVPPNPSELLASHAMAALLEQLADHYDAVVVDAPPVLPVADATGLAALVDGVLVCARWGRVTEDQLGRTAAALERVDAAVLGVLLTMVPGKAEPVPYGYGAVADSGRRRKPVAAQPALGGTGSLKPATRRPAST